MTPQQIKNEVEKHPVLLDNIFWDETLTTEQKTNELICLVDLILTEYDKSIKEMIEELPTYTCESVDSDSALYVPDEDGNWINKRELLSKIGDNSEVEK